ncbi:hypothetical protein HBI56_042390 [Parastagonospora nodorum]|uniref:Uncharacterized protein n=1 Tax=Phaeosphaeria nodorum (strain SN15 / ATCC MYA-4574 / FGSC 10173) TaxID=321614 RepID=A0A7U2EU81_PHANO|nr:hypothetical protein HBH56_240710 [Parastagonospora nodorum]QRC93175.1 hypothetical protein JI435_429050 [Parastagonospora nodorum SN15]KAH3932363.1 hypothetical protein HBH54_083730 [Parastagonospora nodorum]KAH4004888.1 hypothetical protein HBI10_045670 [Parastagonospora nodorum]KAH4031130.1 hypothetical protein HBI13_029120 [Parastagonospora nodorum]
MQHTSETTYFHFAFVKPNIVTLSNALLDNPPPATAHTYITTNHYEMTRCAETNCTRSVILPPGRELKANFICKMHKLELYRSCAQMIAHCQHGRMPTGGTPEEGLNEVLFGWMRGARRHSSGDSHLDEALDLYEMVHLDEDRWR